MSTTPLDDPSATHAVRVIKKYPNRRLYDTETSSYITLADVKDLVMRAKPFVVRDAKTNEDLTRSLLLQIILEEETGGMPIFSEALLANIVRFYGHAMQGFMGNYLEQMLQNFMEMQTQLAQQSKSLSPELWTQFMNLQTPVFQNLASTYLGGSQQSLGKMQEQLQEQMLTAFGLKRP